MATAYVLPETGPDEQELAEATPPREPWGRFRTSNHGQSQLLKNALKQQIRSRGFRYQDIADHLGVSVMTIKRYLNSDRVPVEALEEICGCLGMTLMDLAELAKNEDSGSGRDLDLEQEQALASDDALALVRFLLYSGWTVKEIFDEYELDEPTLVHLLTRLDRLRLIELLPGNRVRIRGSRTIEWRRGGPMRKVMERDIRTHFVNMPFADTADYFGYETVHLSEASLVQIEDMMRHLVRTARVLHQVDRNMRHAKKKWVTLLVAKRDKFWGFPLRNGDLKEPKCNKREAGSSARGELQRFRR